MDEMVAKITQIAKLELLDVHPESGRILAQPDVREKANAYTAALHRFNAETPGEGPHQGAQLPLPAV